jgi:hypothetical protein
LTETRRPWQLQLGICGDSVTVPLSGTVGSAGGPLSCALWVWSAQPA